MDGVDFPRTEVFRHAVIFGCRIHGPENNAEGGLKNKDEYSESESCCSCRQRCPAKQALMRDFVAIPHGSMNKLRDVDQVLILQKALTYTMLRMRTTANVELGTTKVLLKHNGIDGPALGIDTRPLLKKVGKLLKMSIDGGTLAWRTSSRPGANSSTESDMSFATTSSEVRMIS